MSRFNQVFTSYKGLFKQLQHTAYVDLGSSQTRILINGRVVWHQPTLIAWHQAGGSIVAFGERAEKLRGKLPPHVRLVAPVRGGLVADLDFTQYYLESVFNHLKKELAIKSWLPWKCYLAVGAQYSPVERRQLRQLLSRAGLKGFLVSKAEASAGLDNLVQMTQTHGVVDLGAETIEVALFSGQSPLLNTTLHLPIGRELTQIVIDQVKAEHQLEIGWVAAEKIKSHLGRLSGKGRRESMLTVSGKVDQKLTTSRVSSSLFQPRWLQLGQQVVTALGQTFNQVSPEFLSQIQEQGLFLTGGSAQLAGWSELIEERLGLPVVISTQPEIDLVTGLSRAN